MKISLDIIKAAMTHSVFYISSTYWLVVLSGIRFMYNYRKQFFINEIEQLKNKEFDSVEDMIDFCKRYNNLIACL